MKNFRINRAPDGITAAWVGGGAMTNTFIVTVVLRPTVSGQYRLPNPVFIRTTGTLANCQDQALVELNEKDFILTMRGTKPIVAENPDITMSVVQVAGFYRDADGFEYVNPANYEVSIPFNKIPESVIRGAEVYHNRKGNFFVHGGESGNDTVIVA